jgi:hypothetical protein
VGAHNTSTNCYISVDTLRTATLQTPAIQQCRSKPVRGECAFPFVVSLSNHERIPVYYAPVPPFDRLRVNGFLCFSCLSWFNEFDACRAAHPRGRG